MWDEDPRFQEAHYRFVVGSAGVITLLATLLSIVFWDWEFLQYWFTWLGVIVGALSLYAASVWLIGHSLRLIIRFVRRLARKRNLDA